MSQKNDTTGAIWSAFAANAVVAAFKGAGAVYSGSGALLAEAVHSLADTGNQLLLLLGVRQSKRVPDEQHPLGYGKSLYFWALIVAVLLFTVGGLYSVYEGLHRLEHNTLVDNPVLALVILVIAMLAEGMALRKAVKEINLVRGGKSIFRWFRESRQTELIVIFGEDSAALLGLSFALLALLATLITGDPVYDALGSLFIGVLLVVVAVFVTIEIKSLITGESASAEVRKGIRDYITNHTTVDEVLELITLQWGNNVIVIVKARMSEMCMGDSARQLVENINEVERGIKQLYPQCMKIIFEPDFDNGLL
ncbi:MAG: cation diffusion facilitator family transporter [Chromatiales bacterium]|jgi:cation diffusion facilitator family transporter